MRPQRLSRPLERSRATLVALAALAALAASSIAAPATAQDFELNRFHPASSVRAGYITVDDGRTALEGDYEVGLWLHYADDPLVFTHDDDRIYERAVGAQLMADLTASVALVERLRLSLDIPIYLLQTSDFDPFNTGASSSLEGGGFGDIRLTPKVLLWDGRSDSDSGSAVSFGLPLVLPTGNGDRVQGGPFRAVPTVYWDHVLGSGIGIGANVGVVLTGAEQLSNLGVNEALRYGAAVKVPVSDPVAIVIEAMGGLPLTDGVDSEEIQLEGLGMVRYTLNDLVLGGGAGLGMREGYGTPDFRLLFHATWAPAAEEPVPPPSDRDGDGYYDDQDACPDDPEDFDGWQDEDGCPEADNDFDGYLDAEDGCPNDAEDFDGWQDEDGCPDADNDDDQVLDGDDQCPGVDGDVLEEIQEVHNGYLDEDGCPDALAVLEEDRIELNGIIYFDLDSDVIQSRSFEVIEDVAKVLADHDEVLLVEIAGHTDARGLPEYNLELSQRRVESVVRALAEHGIDAARLQPRGYGATQLVDEGTTEQAHQRNRRVEFIILERATEEQ